MLLLAGAGPLAGTVGRELAVDGLRFLALAAGAFGAGAVVGAAMPEGFAAALTAGVVGSVLYAAGLGADRAPPAQRARRLPAPSRVGLGMTATLVRPEPGLAAAAPAGRARRSFGDGAALLALAVLFALVTALTWRKWGVPEIDAGAELTTADAVARGAVPYDDVRYYYGPLGLYGLALTFKALGTGFTAAYVFGLAQAAGILGLFYALARHWLRPAFAAVTTAVLLTIGFSGTAFNFVLPHTNSATVGILCLLGMLLALARGRLLLAGVVAGLVALTRPELAAVAAGAAVCFLIGTWRDQGRDRAVGAALRLALPAVAVPLVVYGAFALQAGVSRLLWENLWPADFIRVAGFRTQEHWMPFTPESFAALAGRAVVYGGLLAGLLAAAVKARRARGTARLSALWPLAAALGALVVVDGGLRVTGLLATERGSIEDDVRHLMLGMTWLPALAFAVAAWCAVRFLRHRRSPLGGSWPVDLALAGAAAALGLRAYNAFATEGSYAVYYAAPLVLLLGILHQRAADRWPAARAASLGALAVVAVGLGSYAMLGLYADQTTTVHTPRGTFVTTAAAAPAIEAAVERVVAATRPGDAILAGPADGGLYFMTDRRPGLYEVMLLPGLLDTPADERAAIASLRRRGVRVAVIGARDFTVWGWPRFGEDYNPLLGAYLRGATAERTVTGTLADPPGGTNPSIGFEVLRLSDGLPSPALHVARRACDDGRTAAQARSPAAPLCSIERAIALAPPGWRVKVGEGRYPALVVRRGEVTVEAAGTGTVRLPHIRVGDGAAGVAFEGLELTGRGRRSAFVVDGGARDVRLAGARIRVRDRHAVELRAGASDVVVEESVIHTAGSGSGVLMASQAPVANAPAKVDPQPPIRDVVIRGNHFNGIAVDAVRPANFERLVIEGNEFEGVDETGVHNDVVQVVWGGRGLVFRDNLVHDNTGQGLFIKDGRVRDVLVEGNLFARNVGSQDRSAGSPINLYDVHGLRISGNTAWDNDAAVMLRSGVRDAVIEGNVLEAIVAEPGEEASLRANVRQNRNVVGGGWNWGAVGPGDVEETAPSFRDPASLDYRLANPVGGLDAGVQERVPPAR